MRLVGLSSDNRYFTVDENNIRIIPKGWKIYRPPLHMFYNKKTNKIVKQYEAVRELKTKEDVEKFKAINENNIDLLFGYFKRMIHYG